MRLDHIKLSGFKSFVDNTIVKFPGNLSAIVGPNGCGKSNIIDAVRWVMGESSAKHLRGNSIVDVIFNGSAQRSASGQASIELHFDNKDGKAGGAYQQYAEIVIRRQVNLDGQSTYYLNNAVCRRRDITDLFLGTGLGPRSYAVIEQGTISKLVDAKPEELRVYLEEAAGISKYKERRRETELRLGHTRDNLARLNDIRDELGKQLNHLGKQAQAAEKYQLLKEEEKTAKAELLALRAYHLNETVNKLNVVISNFDIEHEQINAASQALNTQRETEQQTLTAISDSLRESQKEKYDINTQLARLEEQLRNHEAQKKNLNTNILQLNTEQTHLQQQQKEVFEQQVTLAQTCEKLLPEINQINELLETQRLSLSEKEILLNQAQHEAEQFHQQSALNLQASQIEQTKIQHSEKQLHQYDERVEKLTREQLQYTESNLVLDIQALQEQLELYAEKITHQQVLLTDNHHELEELRKQNADYQQLLDTGRRELQSLHGRYASLQALQESALGKNKEISQAFLEQNSLEHNARLAEKLVVDNGWELAVETILGQQLEAVCVDNLDILIQAISSKVFQAKMADQLFSADCSVNIISDQIDIDNNFSHLNSPRILYPDYLLSTKCQAPAALLNLLSYVYAVESIEQGLEFLSRSDAAFSVITKEGIWIGQGWMRILKSDTQKGNVILRGKALTELHLTIESKSKDVQLLQQKLEQNQTQLKEHETCRQQLQKELNELTVKHADVKSKVNIHKAQFAQHEQRRNQLAHEIEELKHQKSLEHALLEKSRESWEIALEKLSDDTNQRETIQAHREHCRHAVQTERHTLQINQQHYHEKTTQLKIGQSELASLENLNQRLVLQLQQTSHKKSEMQACLDNLIPGENDYQESLNLLLKNQQEIDKMLQEKRALLSKSEETTRSLENQQKLYNEKLQVIRSGLEHNRLSLQTALTQLDAIKEQLMPFDLTLETLWQTLDTQLPQSYYEDELSRLSQKIDKLGLINLAAISEHAQQAQRKLYLDNQHDDLMSALTMLEEAIRKIDRETRTKFKEVYEKVNQLFSALFPRIFGGGKAVLNLTGEDLLETGVQILAQPPGKRNSTIHLLSGGEKALTAIALVFAIFELNPTPFCILDEVDAPLDDANISRFCELVKEMSRTVQFIFISHNKLAIEMAEHLIGVTMKEPGVSRLVTVDIQAAMEMAVA